MDINNPGMEALGPLQGGGAPQQAKGAAGKGPQAQGANFKDVLADMFNNVNKLQENADESIKKLTTGEIKDVHQVMIAVEEAGMAFDMVMEMRNKLIEAYKTIERMQI